MILGKFEFMTKILTKIWIMEEGGPSVLLIFLKFLRKIRLKATACCKSVEGRESMDLAPAPSLVGHLTFFLHDQCRMRSNNFYIQSF